MQSLAAISGHLPDSCMAATCFKVTPMNDRTHLMAWVTRETKDRFVVLARTRELSESALLKQLIEVALAGAGFHDDKPTEVLDPVSAKERLSVRLQVEDVLLLRERARARGLPTSRYVTLLVRSHLRNVAPLPTAELDAQRRSIAEVGAIGRNLNQMSRALHQGQIPNGPTRADIQILLRGLRNLKDQIKAVVAANLTSWRDGHENGSDASKG